MTALVDQARALQRVLVDLNVVSLARLLGLWRETGSDPDAMVDHTPGLIQPFLEAAGLVTAQWYDELAPQLKFHAAPMIGVPRERIDESARWAMFSPGQASPLHRLAGSTQRMIFDASRNTAIGNARAEGVRWARYASASACDFCLMLASRGAVYHSEDAALAAHDHCKCTAVPERSGTSWQLAS